MQLDCKEESMAGIENVRLRVTPSQLQNKADEVLTQVQIIQREFEILEQLVKKTTGYWIGDAGDLHREKYEEGKETIEQMLRRWREHPKDLLQMAGIYSEAEHKLEEVALELPDNVIE